MTFLLKAGKETFIYFPVSVVTEKFSGRIIMQKRYFYLNQLALSPTQAFMLNLILECFPMLTNFAMLVKGSHQKYSLSLS